MQSLYRQLFIDKENHDKSSYVLNDLQSLYRLYLYLLATMEELGWYVKQHHDKTRHPHISMRNKFQYTLRLHENFITQKLLNDPVFQKTKKEYKIIWNAEDSLIRRMFLDLKASELYQEYIHSRDKEAFEDEEILVYFLKHYTNYFNLFRQHLDEMFSNFGDDLKIALNMAIKTVRNIASNPDSDDFLLQLSTDWEDKKEYTVELYQKSLACDEDFDKYISPRITKWEPKQIARIDMIILRMALTEFLHFPTIPVEVTINEYIELAKTYSNPGSKKFINALLDSSLESIKKDKRLNKPLQGQFKNQEGS